MFGIHGLAFHEQRVEFREQRMSLAFVVAQLEAHVRRLGEDGSVAVRPLSLADHRFAGAFVETGHASDWQPEAAMADMQNPQRGVQRQCQSRMTNRLGFAVSVWTYP
jgi:hypothetical protein